nr:DUF2891 family protein [Streptomyces cacaoi]
MSTHAPAALSPAQAAGFAALAVANITRAYPNAPAHLIASPDELVPPRTYHPAFYGAYDWHSSVHMHWLLVRLLRRGLLTGPKRAEAVRALDAHLTAPHLRTEAEYLRAHPSFERPYGWAWLLALAAECTALAGDGPREPGTRPDGGPAGRTPDTEPDGQPRNEGSDGQPQDAGPDGQPQDAELVRHARGWARALGPAVDAVAELLLAWLPKATYPVRHGTHANSAFALSLVLDTAERAGRPELVEPVAAQIRAWYLPDHGAAARWEPSGQDFLSPLLSEADALRRVLPGPEFATWLTAFWPELTAVAQQSADTGTTDGGGLLPPPRISDAADPQIGHLFGLCLSRAAALRSLAAALPAGDPRGRALAAAADANLRAGLPAVASGDFTTDHWLATFATLAVDGGTAAR